MKKLSVIVDWLEFTVLEAQMPEVMKLMELKWDNFSPLNKGDSDITTNQSGKTVAFLSCIHPPMIKPMPM